MSELHLHETLHPTRNAHAAFAGLVGLDHEKSRLVEELALLLDASRLDRWRKKHHPKGLSVLQRISKGAPLVVLAGEVGCGKTALATCVASPVAEALDAQVLCLETPSNVRGSGLVGEISNRITTVFSMARSRLNGPTKHGILVIDEADDLATSRTQLQAHHEDRAALNVLVKQIDLVARDAVGLAVILVTNRLAVIDPAIRRRVALDIEFRRPNKDARRLMFSSMLDGAEATKAEIEELVRISERKTVPFSSSDLIHRVARLALTEARVRDEPFSAALVLDALSKTEPTPLLGDAVIT